MNYGDKKILILSDVRSTHTQNWAASLSDAGFEIILFSLSDAENFKSFYSRKIKIFSASVGKKHLADSDSGFGKISYLSAIKKLKAVIKKHKPDILHAHYASSYGLLGALTGFHPFIVSVWGSDVFDFPNKSFLHKKAIRYVFGKADRLLSTGAAMKAEAEQYTDKKFEVTPFGVDVDLFRPARDIFSGLPITIGVVKKMEDNSGIKLIIDLLSELIEKYGEDYFRLLLVGGGTKIDEYKKYVSAKGISAGVIFAGFIPQNKLSEYYNKIDIFLNITKAESFGVSILEASACGIPVIAADVGGVRETVIDKATGFLISRPTIEKIGNKISYLIENEEYARRMGGKGREFVVGKYSRVITLRKMIDIYREFFQNRKALH